MISEASAMRGWVFGWAMGLGRWVSLGVAGCLYFAGVDLRAAPGAQPEALAQVLGHFNGLEESTLKAMVEVLVGLGEGKPESAAKIFQDRAQKVLTPDSEFEATVRRDFSKLAGRLSFMETVEYVGYTRISMNLRVVFFALNSEYNVHYFGFSLARQAGEWRFKGYVWRTDWEDMLSLRARIQEQPAVVWEFPRVGR
jgi:hypothetical protein